MGLAMVPAHATAPKPGPFHVIIDEILAADEEAPQKQRYTRARHICSRAASS